MRSKVWTQECSKSYVEGLTNSATLGIQKRGNSVKSITQSAVFHRVEPVLKFCSDTSTASHGRVAKLGTFSYMLGLVFVHEVTGSDNL